MFIFVKNVRIFTYKMKKHFTVKIVKFVIKVLKKIISIAKIFVNFAMRGRKINTNFVLNVKDALKMIFIFHKFVLKLKCFIETKFHMNFKVKNSFPKIKKYLNVKIVKIITLENKMNIFNLIKKIFALLQTKNISFIASFVIQGLIQDYQINIFIAKNVKNVILEIKINLFTVKDVKYATFKKEMSYIDAINVGNVVISFKNFIVNLAINVSI